MTDGAAPTATSWPRVLLLVGAGIVASFQIGKAPPALPDLRAGLDLGLVAAGWVISIYAFVTAGCGALGGALADAAGHRRAVLFGLACLAVGSAAGAMAQGPALLLAGRFVEGIGYVPIMVSTPALIQRAARPADTGLAFGLWGANMPAGTATMILAAPPILASLGWQGLWLANAVLAAGYALLFAAGTRGLAVPAAGLKALAPAPLLRDLWAVLRSPGPLSLALFFATYTGNYLAIFGFLPTLLIERMGAAPATAAQLTAFAIAINIFGNVGGGWLRKRGVALRLLFVGGSLVIGALALAVYAEGLSAQTRYLAVVALSLCAGVIPGAAWGAAPAFAPRPRLAGTSSGLLAQGANIGMLVWPPALAAIVAAGGGWHAAPWLVTTAAFVGAVLGWIAGGFERRAA